VIVRKLTIKDTDAGLLNANVFEQKGYLERIRHLHPRTYECLQTLAREWEEDPSVRAFFHQECTFSESQLARFEKYLRQAATTLRKRHENGTLHLDLDLDAYFQSPDSPPSIPAILASVGRWERGAVNRPADVTTVQRLLTAAARASQTQELDPKGADGRIAAPPRESRTVGSIEVFERLRNLPVRGVIEPGSRTWKMLLSTASQSPARDGEDPTVANRTAMAE
jgi:hypothetical protein